MSEAVKLQDPAETLDYSLDWTSWIGATGDTITGAVWAISPTGPTLSGQAQAGNVCTVIVAGVVFAQIYKLTNTVTTGHGRTSDRSITIRAFLQ